MRPSADRVSALPAVSVVDLERLLDELAASSIECVLVGGLAARLRGAPVYTEDVDVVYSLSDDNVARAARWLTSIDARFVARSELAPNLSDLKSRGHKLLMTPWGRLDFLGAAGADRDYEGFVADAAPFGPPESELSIASLKTVILLKEEADRPKERAVLPLLRSVLKQSELA